jgi:hypothetical protein
MRRWHGTVRLPLLILLIAFALNLGWEMLQMFAYFGLPRSPWAVWLVCGLASVIDAVYALLLYRAGSYLTGDSGWALRLNLKRICVIAVTGFVTAVVVERAALALDLWSYSAEMIRLPLLRAGILPVLQLILLPLVTFWLVKVWEAPR